MATSANGTVYATNAGYAAGALFAFTPSLEALWVESIPNVSTSNPALGPNGELAIAGSGSDVRVYRDAQAVAERLTPEARRPTLEARPNPCRGATQVNLKPQASSSKPLTLRVYDVSGCLVHSGIGFPTSSFRLDLRSLPAGAYVVRSGDATTVLTLTR
jgi:hypothetical protein